MKINDEQYRLEYPEYIVLTDGTVCLGIADHNNKIIKVATSGGRRKELEMLDTLLHEATHVLVRQYPNIIKAPEHYVVIWIATHISKLLYDNPDVFRPYLKQGNKKRALRPVS